MFASSGVCVSFFLRCVCLFPQVCVLYFAKSVELTGVKEEIVAVPTPISSRDLWRLLLQRHQRYRDVFTDCW